MSWENFFFKCLAKVQSDSGNVRFRLDDVHFVARIATNHCSKDMKSTNATDFFAIGIFV